MWRERGSGRNARNSVRLIGNIPVLGGVCWLLGLAASSRLSPSFSPTHRAHTHTSFFLLFHLHPFVKHFPPCASTHTLYLPRLLSLSLSCGGAYSLRKWIPSHKLLAHSAQSLPFYQHFRHHVLHYIAESVGNRRSLNKHFSKHFFSNLLYCVSLTHVCTSDPCRKQTISLLSDPCHSPAIELGNDMCLRPVWQFRCLRRSGQHLLHLQPQDKGGEREGQQGAAGTHRLPLLLPVSRRLTNSDFLW